MNANGKLLSTLLLFASIGLLVLFGILFGDAISISKQTLDFQDKNNSIDFELDETTNFILLADYSSANNSSNSMLDYDCEMEDLNLYCDKILSYGEIESVVVQIYDRDDEELYFFQGMGNTEVSTNNYTSVGKIELPPGNYHLDTLSSTLNVDVNLKLMNSSLISMIVFTIFSGILGIACFVGFIFISILINKRKLKRGGYDYYDSRINEQDHNNDLFDADDPFSRYDK